MPPPPVRFTSIRFNNYKTFRNFNVSLDHVNVLVGANNAGKSTILGAFRILSEGLRKALARKAELVNDGERDLWGYKVDLSDLPISTENVFTDYDDSVPARVAFRLSNGNTLSLVFPTVGTCVLVPDAKDRAIRSPADFQKSYPVRVAFVPVLGPVEHHESLFKQEAARRALLTHGASRNFRNIWYHYPDDFDKFRTLIRSTWPGMDIEPPRIERDDKGPWLVMFCPEQRYPREIFWAGFGLQVWCQMLTYIIRAAGDSLLVIDEPDIYLHSDLQRQLLNTLDALGPDILIATYSTEIIAEAEPRNILLIQKGKTSARRLANTSQLQTVFGVLGSNANPILTQVAKTRRVLFVEGKDFQLLGTFAKRLGRTEVASRGDFAVIPVQGFDATKARAYATGFEMALGARVLVGVIFDRDYRSDEEIDEIEGELRTFADVARIHRRKEVENYVLCAPAIARAIAHRVAEQDQRSGTSTIVSENTHELLTSLTETLKPMVFGQYVAQRSARQRAKRPGLDTATITEAAMRDFEEIWKDFDKRIAMVPGKDIVSLLNQHLQSKYSVSLSPLSIAASMTPAEIDADVESLISSLDTFRKKRPPEETE